ASAGRSPGSAPPEASTARTRGRPPRTNGGPCRSPPGTSAPPPRRASSSAMRQSRKVRHAEPQVALLAVEEPHQDGDEGCDVEPETEHPERPVGADDGPDKQREVLAEEAGEERKRQEKRGDPAELLHRQVHLVADRRLVEVGGPGSKIAVVVELFGDTDQVV